MERVMGRATSTSLPLFLFSTFKIQRCLNSSVCPYPHSVLDCRTLWHWLVCQGSTWASPLAPICSTCPYTKQQYTRSSPVLDSVCPMWASLQKQGQKPNYYHQPSSQQAAAFWGRKFAACCAWSVTSPIGMTNLHLIKSGSAMVT